MDADENIIFQFAYNSNEQRDLDNVEVSLRCVLANDSLADDECLPTDAAGGSNCANPTRATSGVASPHTACPASYMSILNSPMSIGKITAGSAIASNFNIKMGTPAVFSGGCDISDPAFDPGCPRVELVLDGLPDG